MARTCGAGGSYRLSEIRKAVEHTLRGGKVLLDVAEG
jgi:hypothetical protein